MSVRDAIESVARSAEARGVTTSAIGGTMAKFFRAEPVATCDLAVFALMRSGSGLPVSRSPIHEWAKERDDPRRPEHIVIDGAHVQVIPAHNALAEEAVTIEPKCFMPPILTTHRPLREIERPWPMDVPRID